MSFLVAGLLVGNGMRDVVGGSNPVAVVLVADYCAIEEKSNHEEKPDHEDNSKMKILLVIVSAGDVVHTAEEVTTVLMSAVIGSGSAAMRPALDLSLIHI